ncbi:MAG: type II CAAX endopeptidase family protein [Pseudomonadota bacterium]
MTTAHRVYIAPARARPGLWRLVLGLLLVALVYLALNGIAFLVYALRYGPDDASLLFASLGVASTPGSLLLVLATFFPMILGLALVCYWPHRRSFGSLIGPAPRALRDFFRAIAVFGVIYGAASLAFFVMEPTQPNLPVGLWAQLLPLLVIGLIIQTGAEELLFRGYLQQQLAARFASPLIWAVLPSLLFGLLHYDPVRLGAVAPAAVLAAQFFGLIAADLTVKSGTLGAAWGAHFANNFFAIGVISVDGSLTGMALRLTDFDIVSLAEAPWLLALDVLPLCLAWLILRRWIITS